MSKTRIFCIVLCVCVVVSLIACPSGEEGDETPFADKVWGTAQLIETDSGFALFAQVGVDGSGNAVAVWWQRDGARSNIWANTRR